MAQTSTRGAFRWSLALAWGFLVILVTASWVGADDAVPRVAVRVQGAWLNYRDDNPVHTGEGAVDSRLDFRSAAGVEVGVELRPWRLLGIEIATAYVPFEVRETDFISLFGERTVEKSRPRFQFRPLSVGLDFHIPAGKKVDIYLGPTHGRLIYGGRNHFGDGDDLDPHDAFGAVVGVDVKPGTGPFAFTASVRYFRSPLSGLLVAPQTYIDVYLVAPCGVTIACHGLLHLLGDDGAEFMAIFTHGRLESLDPIVEDVSDAYAAWAEASSGRGIPGDPTATRRHPAYRPGLPASGPG